MVYLKFNNKNYNFPNSILKISTYLNYMYDFRTYENEPLPFLISQNYTTLTNQNVFEKFCDWFKLLMIEGITSYDEEELTQRFGQNTILIFKPEFFKDLQFCKLIQIFNFGLNNQIKLLCNTIAYVMSLFTKIDFTDCNIILQKMILETKNKLIIDYVKEINIITRNNIYFKSKRNENETIYLIPYNLIKNELFFINCNNLQKVKLPFNFKFYSKDWLNKFNIKDCPKLNLIHNDTILKIPQNTTNYIIPKNIKLIYSKAFENCVNLTDIDLKNVKIIGYSAFTNSRNLQNITLPSSFIEIKDNAFCDCINLKTITTQCSKNNCLLTTELNNCVFYNCKCLKEINICYVNRIGCSAFENCISLSKITFSTSLKTIEQDAFSNCIKLKSLDLPDSVEDIKERAFAKCSSLQNIHIPSNLKIIKSYTFDFCKSLRYLKIPNNVTIRENAFLNCDNLLIDY